MSAPRFAGVDVAWSPMRGFDLGLAVVRWRRIWWRFYRVEFDALGGWGFRNGRIEATHWVLVFFRGEALEEFFEGSTK